LVSEAYKRPNKINIPLQQNTTPGENHQRTKEIMAIKQIKSTCGYMTMEEFKEWLKQLDTNKDGQLSREELRKALRKRGVGRVTAFRSIRLADKDRNGFIDEAEVENLISLAQKSFGIRVWSWLSFCVCVKLLYHVI
jgi:calmodulin